MVLDAGRMFLGDLEQFSKRKITIFYRNWNFPLKVVTLVEYTFSTKSLTKEYVPDENLSQFPVGLLMITKDTRDVSKEKLAFVIEYSRVFSYCE